MTEQQSTETEQAEEVTDNEETVDTRNFAEADEQSAEEETEETTFPLAYVQKLRQEAAEARTKAKRADDLGTRLHTALVAASGRLADPSDLPYTVEHLDDPEALTTAIDDLLTRKPHLASRRPSGDVGQGASKSGDTVDLAGMLRARA